MEATGQRRFGPTKPLGKYANYDTSVATGTLEKAVAEIEREANVRMKCYDRWIGDGKMTDQEASERLGALVTAWHILTDPFVIKYMKDGAGA